MTWEITYRRLALLEEISGTKYHATVEETEKKDTPEEAHERVKQLKRAGFKNVTAREIGENTNGRKKELGICTCES